MVGLRKNNLIIILVIVLALMGLVYVAYIIDSNQISTSADVESDASIEDIQSLPAPDKSIINKIYTSITNLF